MAVSNIFITELNKKQIWEDTEKPYRSNMFVLILISLALRAISHIYGSLQQRKQLLAMTFLNLWHILNVQQSRAFLTRNLFFFYSQIVPFTVLLLLGLPCTSLSHTHTHTESVRINNKLLQTWRLFSNLDFTSKYWKLLFPSKLSAPFAPLCISGGLRLLQEQFCEKISCDLPILERCTRLQKEWHCVSILFVLYGTASDVE